MIYKGNCLLFLLVLTLHVFGQSPPEGLKGEVTFVTSKNIYVKFAQTREIEIGDTLRRTNVASPCLLVTQKSSTSCVCTPIGGCTVDKGEEVWFRPDFRRGEELPGEMKTARLEEQELEEAAATLVKDSLVLAEETSHIYKENIRGRISVSSYSNLGSARDNRNRLMGHFWLDAQHINRSKFSVMAQVNYRQIFPSNPENFAPKTTYFNVYNLAIRYDLDPSFSLVLGRRINPKISSLGAIDGLQAEKYVGKFYVGAIVGSRPDIVNYGFNPSLLQYGAYIGTEFSGKKVRAQTTLGMIEQRNAGNIDRRYAYFQHASTLFRNLNLFSSMELDLYQSVNGVVSTSPRLTNLFVSTTYRFSRAFNVMLSYDSRKRVLYYETFQTDIERLLSEDIARQGLRARVNVRPIRRLNIGLSYSKRFQTDQQNKSDNYQASASYSKIPFIDGRVSLSYNINQSNYLSSNILSVRYSRAVIANKLDADGYFRMADYVYVNSNTRRRQYYYGINLSWRVNRKWALRLSAERSDFNQESNHRIYASIIRRINRTK